MTARPMLVDSHCHLDFPEFAGGARRGGARARARRGVGRLLTICTRLSEFDEVLAIAERYRPDVSARSAFIRTKRRTSRTSCWSGSWRSPSIPRWSGSARPGSITTTTRARTTGSRRCSALHIEAARQTGLPLIVHSRDADEDTVRAAARGRGEGRPDAASSTASPPRSIWRTRRWRWASTSRSPAS